jgi:hypothetical protein
MMALINDPKVCNDDILIPIIITIMDVIHYPIFFKNMVYGLDLPEDGGGI